MYKYKVGDTFKEVYKNSHGKIHEIDVTVIFVPPDLDFCGEPTYYIEAIWNKQCKFYQSYYQSQLDSCEKTK